MRILFSILAISILVFSCKKDDNGNDGNNDMNEIEIGFLQDQTIDVFDVEREYHLFVPDNYLNAPIVMIFHGHTNNSSDFIGLNGETAPNKKWLDIAEEEDVILAIPNGLFVASNEKGWNDCRADASTNSEADDVEFASALLDFILNKYQADSKRIYVNGVSNGGHMCIRLANETPEKITAFAAIISSNSADSECSDSDIPVSALFMNGTADSILPFDGGEMSSNRGEVFSTKNTVNYWVNRNGTDLVADSLNLPDTNLDDDSNVEKFTYLNGTNNTEVVLYKIINGGHADPSKEERYGSFILNFLGNQNGDIEMADEVWAFFKDKTK